MSKIQQLYFQIFLWKTSNQSLKPHIVGDYWHKLLKSMTETNIINSVNRMVQLCMYSKIKTWKYSACENNYI